MLFAPTKLSDRLTIVSILLLVLTGLAVYGVMTLRGQPRVIAESEQLIEQTGSGIVRQLTLKLASIEGITLSMARLAETLPHDEGLYKSTFPHVIDNTGDKAIAGGGIWPEPNSFDGTTVRRSFFWARSPTNQLEYSDDYNLESGPGYHNESWYANARTAPVNRCAWSEAYKDPITKVAMVTCSVPYHVNNRFTGIATIDLKLDNVGEFLTQNGSVTGGYAFALDQSGNILYFPDATLSDSMQHFSDLANTQSWLAPVSQALNKVDPNKVLSIDIEYDNQLKAASRVSLFIMHDTGWIIGLVTPQAKATEIATALTQEILLFLLPLLAILLSLAWLSGKKIIGQLAETTHQIGLLSQGSVTNSVQLIVDRNDEIGELRHAVNHYAGQLKSMLQLITEEAKQLQREATQLSQVSNMLADRAEQQRVGSTQLAAAITEMSANANEVATNTNDCAATAQLSLSIVLQGQERVSANSAAIGSLSGEIANATAVIAKLDRDSQQVGAVLDVIKAISEQTNLLALNAAIEAARAGEQGRGFAVVADEVRTLAGKTQSSANEISGMINSLQNASRLAVQAMQAGETKTAHAVIEADGAANALSTTVRSFEDISERAQQIARAATQQSQVTQEINELAVRINSISEDNSRDAKSLDDLSVNMQSLSARLANLNRD